MTSNMSLPFLCCTMIMYQQTCRSKQHKKINRLLYVFNLSGSEIYISEHFIRNTWKPAYLCYNPISQSCGSSEIIQIKIKTCSLCSHQTSERWKKVWSLNVACLLMPDGLVWVFLNRLISFYVQQSPQFTQKNFNFTVKNRTFNKWQFLWTEKCFWWQRSGERSWQTGCDNPNNPSVHVVNTSSLEATTAETTMRFTPVNQKQKCEAAVGSQRSLV